MISLTAQAATQLLSLLAEKQAETDAGLRIRVEKGGCAGWQYTMGIDRPQPEDHVFREHGVALIVDGESLRLLEHSEIDYSDGLNDAGFRVNNPNATRSCGCGTSFEPKPAP